MRGILFLFCFLSPLSPMDADGDSGDLDLDFVSCSLLPLLPSRASKQASGQVAGLQSTAPGSSYHLSGPEYTVLQRGV